MKAYNLTNDQEYTFQEGTSPEHAARYAYAEQHNLLSWYLAALGDGRTAEIDAKLPLTIGKTSVACGDWAAKKPEEKQGPEIRTNNHARPLLSWYELTEKEQAEFDYIENPEEETGLDFFRFKKRVYTLSDFMRIDQQSTAFPGWHGYKGDSFFSGILIKLSDDGEAVTVGQYFS